MKPAATKTSMFEILPYSKVLRNAKLMFNGEIARNTREFQEIWAFLSVHLYARAIVS